MKGTHTRARDIVHKKVCGVVYNMELYDIVLLCSNMHNEAYRAVYNMELKKLDFENWA